ncbi:MAG: 16S rRNA (guanine(966)-N(2))-methyltransferase RsmD [Cellulosilyticaceae bacterium]
MSGKCRGTKLEAPEGTHTRPTTDRIKETLFNIIAFDIPGCKFLDLFSGSGAIGIEALSRGAVKSVFIDNNSNAINCINKNLQKTGLQNLATVYNIDIGSGLQKLANQSEKFDIIFMDPPYNLEGLNEIFNLITSKDLLSENGYIILENASEAMKITNEKLELVREKNYKTTTLSFFERI